jgi:hypothetical protein
MINSNSHTDIERGEILHDEVHSNVAQQGSDVTLTANSIPVKLRRWYGHKTFKALIMSVLSLTIVSCTFASLFYEKLTSCEVIGIITSILMLYADSPLRVG